MFDEEVDAHPQLAVRDGDFQEDDPKEFVDYYKARKTPQKNRMVRYLKAWCDNVRDSMPSGLSMTVMTLDHYQYNDRDDVALKFLLIEMENALKWSFSCIMPTTPGDDLFAGYSEAKKETLVVVDGTTGQNELSQAKEFLEAEVALCRLVQDICFKLTQSLDFE